jgi:hypothetical protein
VRTNLKDHAHPSAAGAKLLSAGREAWVSVNFIDGAPEGRHQDFAAYHLEIEFQEKRLPVALSHRREPKHRAAGPIPFSNRQKTESSRIPAHLYT